MLIQAILNHYLNLITTAFKMTYGKVEHDYFTIAPINIYAHHKTIYTVHEYQ